MANPNNCETCQYHQVNPSGGWCYMFRDEPNEVCMKHTARDDGTRRFEDALRAPSVGRLNLYDPDTHNA